MRQETTKNLLMTQVQEMAQLLKQDETIVRLILNQTMDTVSELVRASSGKLAKKLSLGTNDVMTTEVTRFIVGHVIRQSSDQFRRIMTTNYPAKTHVQEVETTLDIQAGLIHEILTERKPLSSIITDLYKRDKLEMQMIAVMNEAKLQQHFARMLRMQEAVFRPLEKDDIPHIEQLYRDLMIDGESLVKMANGVVVSKSFLEDPDKHEIPVMKELMQVTQELQRYDRIKMRREKQTMVGTVLHSKVDKHAILAVYIRTRAPMDPKKDKRYREESEAFIEQGASGGIMTYADTDESGQSVQKDMFREHLLGKGGKSEQVFLVISCEPGLGHQTQAESLATSTDVVQGTKVFTYARRDMEITVDGERIRRMLPKTRNDPSIHLLERGRMTVSVASDQNEKAPYKEFMVKGGEKGDQKEMKIGGKSAWLHLTGDLDEMIRSAKNLRDT